MQEQATLKVPVGVISPIDVARITRELEQLDEFFRQADIRTGGTPQSPPRYSRLLDEIVSSNGLNLLDASQRENTVRLLRYLGENAPVLHMSFSADPPGPYVQKIVTWLRNNIHPQVLVRVGLQPTIGAGCVVRSQNKAFDFSLRSYFDSKHEFFMQKLHEVLIEKEAEAGQSSPAVRVAPQEQPPSAPLVSVLEQPSSPVQVAADIPKANATQPTATQPARPQELDPTPQPLKPEDQ